MEISDYRINVVMILPNLERLDKDPVSAEEKNEAWEKLRVNRIIKCMMMNN